jgi:hypothetical protein
MTQFVLSVLPGAENTCMFADIKTDSVGTESLVVSQPEGSDPSRIAFAVVRGPEQMYSYMLLKPAQVHGGVAQVVHMQDTTRVGVCVGTKLVDQRWLLHHEMGHVAQFLRSGVKDHLENVVHRRADLERDADDHAFKAMSSRVDCLKFNSELAQIRLTGGLNRLAGAAGNKDYAPDLVRVARCFKHPKGD